MEELWVGCLLDLGFHRHIQQTKPNKVRKTDLSNDTQGLLTTDIQVSVFKSINKKLDLLAMLYQEMKG